MKRALLTIASAATLLAGAALADPILGTWKTEPSDGVFYHVQMGTCGGAICGKYAKKYVNGEVVEAPEIGKNAVYDMMSVGNGFYEGKAWRSSDDKTFKGKGELQGDRLEMKGCVLGGLICQGQTWTRVN